MRQRRRQRQQQAELNVTAFLNLMVVLVPFLLISAVFSQVAILEINIPQAVNQPPPEEQDAKKQQVIVIVRSTEISIEDGVANIAKISVDADGNFETAPLLQYLHKVKKEQPTKLDSTILLEPEIPYERLITIMDMLKYKVEDKQGSAQKTEMFPIVSIGDAPAVLGATDVVK